MDIKICRVCLEKSESMVNIFDHIGILDRRISIADMITQCTGFQIFKADPFPKTICAPCKQDATNAYEIKRLYETSHKVFCQMGKDMKKARKKYLSTRTLKLKRTLTK
ncbi:uncharacterized protein LOC110187551 [Drosophila serrata]|uniref:uncharacterized protein LOC110187551 n=1 Tax=Drosophila serrata TaxID=7274 RepID=UPI000A1D1BE8|nr:uncharacterized protein LOC110187551 [Drosophila serrata]